MSTSTDQAAQLVGSKPRRRPVDHPVAVRADQDQVAQFSGHLARDMQRERSRRAGRRRDPAGAWAQLARIAIYPSPTVTDPPRWLLTVDRTTKNRRIAKRRSPPVD